MRKCGIYIYTMEDYLTTEKNDILSFIAKWMELEDIRLGEISQADRQTNTADSLSYVEAKIRPTSTLVISRD